MSLTMSFASTPLQPLVSQMILAMYFSTTQDFCLMDLIFTDSLYQRVLLSRLFKGLLPYHFAIRHHPFSFIILVFTYFFRPILGNTKPSAIFNGYVYWFLLSAFLRFTYQLFLLRYRSWMLARRSVYISIIVLVSFVAS